jgi:transcription initiation factor TFIID TATA-box-binding protein
MAKKRTAKPTVGEPGATSLEIKPEWKIENVVATVSIELEQPGEKIDLNQIARKYTDCEYNPERFPGLVMRVEDPKATILIFSTGKMVVTGLRQASEAETVVNNVINKMKKAKVNIKSEPEITIQNIVASGDLHTSIDLNEAAIIMENAMYEPEVFPGLIYRMQEPKTVFLIFSTGRIVCTGGKTKEIVGEAIEKLVEQVKEYGVAGVEGGGESSDDDFI